MAGVFSVMLRLLAALLFLSSACSFVASFQFNSFGDLDKTIMIETSSGQNTTIINHKRREYTTSRSLLLMSVIFFVLAVGVSVATLHRDGTVHRMEFVGSLIQCVRELTYESPTRPPQPFAVGDADDTVLLSTATRYNEVCGFAQRASAQWMQYDFQRVPVTDDRNGAVYVTKGNKLVALEASTGQTRWVWENVNEDGYPSFASLSQPVVGSGGDEKVYVATIDNRLHAIDQVDGTLAWTQAPSELEYARVFLVHEQRLSPRAEVPFVIITLMALLVGLALIPEFFLKSVTVYSGECPDAYDACYVNADVPVFETDFDALPFDCSRPLEGKERLHCFSYVGFSFGTMATAVSIVYSFILLEMLLTSMFLQMTMSMYSKTKWATACFIAALVIIAGLSVALTQRLVESFSTSDLIQGLGFALQAICLGVILIRLESHDAFNKTMRPYRQPYRATVASPYDTGSYRQHSEEGDMQLKYLPEAETNC